MKIAALVCTFIELSGYGIRKLIGSNQWTTRLPIFLSWLRRAKKNPMDDFTIAVGKSTATFRLGADYAEGENRFCWTLAGIEKLIGLGLWRREFDGCGNLKSKPMTVEAAMRLPRR